MNRHHDHSRRCWASTCAGRVVLSRPPKCRACHRAARSRRISSCRRSHDVALRKSLGARTRSTWSRRSSLALDNLPPPEGGRRAARSHPCSRCSGYAAARTHGGRRRRSGRGFRGRSASLLPRMASLLPRSSRFAISAHVLNGAPEGQRRIHCERFVRGKIGRPVECASVRRSSQSWLEAIQSWRPS